MSDLPSFDPAAEIHFSISSSNFPNNLSLNSASQGDHRPKSSYVVRDGSPQSPRDKRPLSGPNIRTPNLPVTEGGIKTAQQSTRPFNTYPRTDSDGGRSPTGQVRVASLTKRQASF